MPTLRERLFQAIDAQERIWVKLSTDSVFRSAVPFRSRLHSDGVDFFYSRSQGWTGCPVSAVMAVAPMTAKDDREIILA